MTGNYSIDDELGNRITAGTWADCLSAARSYLSAHKDAPCVLISDSYGETSVLTRDEVLS